MWSVMQVFYNWTVGNFGIVLGWCGDIACYLLGMTLTWITAPLRYMASVIPWPDLVGVTVGSATVLTCLDYIKPWLQGANYYVPLDYAYISLLRYTAFRIFLSLTLFIRRLLPV